MLGYISSPPPFREDRRQGQRPCGQRTLVALPLALNLAPQEGREPVCPCGTSQLCRLEKYPQNTIVSKAKKEPDAFNWTLPPIGCLKFKVSATSIKLFPSRKQPLPWRGEEGPSQSSPKADSRPSAVPRVIQTSRDKPPKKHAEKLATLHRAQQASLQPVHTGINTYLLSTKLGLMTLACLTGSS